MKLVRNTTKDGSCKYALLRLDKLRRDFKFIDKDDFFKKYPELKDYIEIGEPKSEEEFFAIKLKDINSTVPLVEYARSCRDNGDKEISEQVMELAYRSSTKHPYCQIPDLLNIDESEVVKNDILTNYSRVKFSEGKEVFYDIFVINRTDKSVKLFFRYKNSRCFDQEIIIKLKPHHTLRLEKLKIDLSGIFYIKGSVELHNSLIVVKNKNMTIRNYFNDNSITEKSLKRCSSQIENRYISI